MTRIGDAVRPNRDPTPTEAKEVQHVRELAVEFDAGRLPIEEVAKLSKGSTRWLATRFTPPDHPAFGSLMRTLDALIAMAEITRTRQGYFTKQDIQDAEAMKVYEGGELLLVFPVRYPWLVKPNREAGQKGKRADAIFRPEKERGPRYKPFDKAPQPIDIDTEKPWWGDDSSDGEAR